MRDNLRRYRAIRDALTQGYPGQPAGTVARHVTTLAALISGIVGSKSTQLPHIATKVPDGAQAESRVKRFARWVRNDRITTDIYFVCAGVTGPAGLADACPHHGWQCRGPWMCGLDAACGL